MAAEGVTLSAAARQLGITPHSLSEWARRNGVAFADGRRKRRKEAPAKVLVLRDFLRSALTAAEWEDYQILRQLGGYSPVEALVSIKRRDLLAAAVEIEIGKAGAR
jgi:transposase-like protein